MCMDSDVEENLDEDIVNYVVHCMQCIVTLSIIVLTGSVESAEVINEENLLVPSFVNLKKGFCTYVKNFPKLTRQHE